MEALQAEHKQHETRLDRLESEVQRATSPPVAGESSQSTGAKPSSSASRASPASLAAQLFHRSKPKSKSSSSSKASKKASGKFNTPSPAVSHADSIAHLDELEREIREIEDEEAALVSSAIGISQDGQAVSEATDGQDDVLDHADRLISQIERAKSAEQEVLARENSLSRTTSAGIAKGSAAASPAELAQPVPIAGSSATRTPSGLSSHSSHQHSHGNLHDLGTKIKHALSPDSVHGDSSSTRDARVAEFARQHSFPGGSSSHNSSHVAPHHSASLPVDTGNAVTSGPNRGMPVKNRHQLRKERKLAEDNALRAQAQAEVDADRSAGKLDPAEVERVSIERQCKEMGLVMVEMDPDGHCMFSAVADQLVVHSHIAKADYHTTRSAAASYMRQHMDDFLPYMPAEDEEGQGEGLLSPEGYAAHCNHIETTAEWGSETELLALSNFYKVPIHVVQSSGPVVKHGDSEPYAKNQAPLAVSYHRAMYGLGEHYNSLRPVGHKSLHHHSGGPPPIPPHRHPPHDVVPLLM